MLNLWSRPADSIFLISRSHWNHRFRKKSRQIIEFKGFISKMFRNKDLEVREFQGLKSRDLARAFAFPAPIRKGAGMICTLFFLL